LTRKVDTGVVGSDIIQLIAAAIAGYVCREDQCRVKNQWLRVIVAIHCKRQLVLVQGVVRRYSRCAAAVLICVRLGPTNHFVAANLDRDVAIASQ
jgi:hypothetical protein